MIHTQEKQAGFTLVELMITIAILAILVGLAVPAYDRYTRNTNRAAAKSVMEKIHGLQEAFYINNKRYTNDLTELGFTAAAITIDRTGGESAVDAIYTVSVTMPGAVCANCRYEINAVAINTQTQDTECLNFMLNSLGQKDASGPKRQKCW